MFLSQKVVEPKRMSVGAIAQLILKKDAPVSSHKGIKLFMINEKTGRPDYNGSTLLLFKNQLDLLLAGAREVEVFVGEPRTQ